MYIYVGTAASMATYVQIYIYRYICIERETESGISNSGSLMVNITVYYRAFASCCAVVAWWAGALYPGVCAYLPFAGRFGSCPGACYVAVGAI